MPRSGSTLVESILSMNHDVCDLGEINFLEESFKEYENSKEDMNFAELYLKKVSSKTNFKITTNKNLYNYLYTGLIASQIPNAKIIHCFRNPLDNILSIYRANFKRGNEYSSSLVDCARIYLDQEDVMKIYRNRLSCIYMLIRISTALAKKGILQPHVLKNSSDTSALVIINAKLAKITPIGAPACAKAP